jgi:hypothetical protein
VGEFEADVNNGGFGQYLGNKGRKRAGEALHALRSIGAKRTADMLASALAPGASDETLERTDKRFYNSAEDLALLTVRAHQT